MYTVQEEYLPGTLIIKWVCRYNNDWLGYGDDKGQAAGIIAKHKHIRS